MNKGSSREPHMVVLGVGGAPHGIRGELRIRTFTEDPLAIAGYGSLAGSDGRSYEIVSVRPAKNVVVVRIKGIESREQAETLNGVEFSVARSALGEAALDEEEFFHADLIGLAAVDETGGRYGRVTAIHDFGGGDMLELALSTRKSAMIPFSKAAVPAVDVAAGTITIDPVAAGLVDEDGQ
ncbi:MAG: ribosome maturation factor RimM [Rhizobiaceae bacterium]